MPPPPVYQHTQSLVGCLPGDTVNLVTLATQTLPALHTPHPHSARRFQPSLTPPYNNDPKDRPWLTHRGQGGSDDILSMSNWPTGGSRSEQTTPQLSPTQLYPPMQPPFRNSPREGPANPLVSLPPLRQLSSTPPSERRYGSSFGVHAMLNPQAEITEQQRNRRRSASQMDSPSPVETQHSSLQSISRPPSVDSTQDEHKSRQFLPPDRRSTIMRHILSPKSPKVHRTQSLSLLNPPTGTIDAHQTPFLTANTRPSELVASHPSLPPANRPVYFTAQPSDPAPPQAMVRADMRRPSIGFPQSGSASPIPQYSPYSQPASVASSQYDNQSTHGQYAPSSTHVPLHDSRHGSIPMETERNSMIPMAPSSQSSIQLMTIKSQTGHQVQIPVDVQAASKVADEKRRRNAGASARFRARRKEKEREASMSISRLEQQLRDAIEDAEFYRIERDYFKSIVFEQPNPKPHYRPSSPRLRRHSIAPSHAPSSTTGPGSDGSYAEYEEDAREEERNVRRRTSNYHPVSGPPPTEPNTAGPPHHGYSVPAFPPVNLPPVQPASHEQFISHPQSASPAMQPAPMDRPVFPNPFTSEPGRYDHRTWSPSQNEPRPN